ncbi:hypothetical protein AB0I98_30350, partial [Streptomyces sp. NPDC050211]|uniref:hypothetical protein n=1 Tax=Streptomyces sp. NPDC050211 TaxID=3154932 RepID=UPI003415D2C0
PERGWGGRLMDRKPGAKRPGSLKPIFAGQPLKMHNAAQIKITQAGIRRDIRRQCLLFLDGHMSAAVGGRVPIPAQKHEVVITRLNVVRLVIAIAISAISHRQYKAGGSLPGASPERTFDAVTVGSCVADHELVTVVDVLHSAAIVREPQGPIAYVSMCRRRREQHHRTHGRNADYSSDRISYFHFAKHSLPIEAKQYDGDIPLVTLLCGSP